MQKTKSIALIAGVLAMSFLIGYLVLAWTEPSQTPPGGNVLTPLNISINAQSKEGALVVGANPSITTGLIVRYGNVGIGTAEPGYPLTINKGGTPWDSFGRVKYPQLMVNNNNQTGGGIAISDDGGFFDWNDGYVTYEPLCCGQGLRVNSNLIVNGTAYANGQPLCQANGTNCPAASTNKCKKKIKPADSSVSCDNFCAADGLICVHAEWPPRSTPYTCFAADVSDGLFSCVCCP